MAKNSSSTAAPSVEPRSFFKQIGIILTLTGISIFLFCLTVVRPDINSMINDNVLQLKGSKDSTVCSEQLLIEVANMEPNRLLAEGKVDEAIGKAIELLKEKPYDVRRIVCAGNILSQVGDQEKGLQLLKKTPYLVPQSRYIRLNYARRLSDAKHYPEAIEQYKILCQVFPRHWKEPRMELARIYMTLGHFDQATEQYTCIANDDSNNGAVLQELGIALAASGDLIKGHKEFVRGFAVGQSVLGDYESIAKEYGGNSDSLEQMILTLRTEIVTKPDSKDLQLRLAQALILAGHVKEAKEILSQARMKHYGDPQLHELLAGILYKLDDQDGSFNEFKIAIDAIKRQHSL